MSLGRNLRSIREKRGLTQDQLAKKTDLSRSQISNIEKGKRNTSFDRLGIIADALDCRVSDLTDDANKQEIEDEENAWILFGERMKQQDVSIEEVEHWVKLAREFLGKNE